MLRSKRGHQPKNRQLGITERPQEHLILVALQFTGQSGPDCQQQIEQLRGVSQRELERDLAEPSTETGELGFASKYKDYRLSITLGLSASGYERLEVPAERRPVDIHPIPPDVLDSSGGGQGSELVGEGDILLKICADDIYIAEHVLRRIESELPDAFTVLWVQTGVQRYNTKQSNDPRKESRALIGFLDGTSNLDPSKDEDRALIFTDHTRTDYPPLPTSDQYANVSFPDLRPPPAQPEPVALDGGTYLAVEVMINKIADFDRLPLTEEERVVGLHKTDGTPAQPQGVTSHVLKANPGRPEDLPRRILRRGYALVRPQGTELARGLILIAFGRTLSTQAEFIRRAWIDNPNFPHNLAGRDLLLSQYVEPRLVCGGYYFVPPLANPRNPWSWIVA